MKALPYHVPGLEGADHLLLRRRRPSRTLVIADGKSKQVLGCPRVAGNIRHAGTVVLCAPAAIKRGRE